MTDITVEPAAPTAPPAPIAPSPGFGVPQIDVAAVTNALMHLSPRVSVSRHTPELALVDLARQVGENSRLLTEAALSALNSYRMADAATGDRVAALEAKLVDMAAALAAMTALNAQPQPKAKPNARSPSKR